MRGVLSRGTERRLVSAAILIGSLALARPALAHKSFIFATLPQGKIVGEVYFNGGEPGRHVTVLVLDPLGTKLGEVVTDEKGRFTFEPRQRCDHRLIADDQLGHRAEYTVKADELPTGLPASAAVPAGGDSRQPARAAAAHGPSSDSPAGQDAAGAEEALSHQIAGLRRDLDRWQARLRMQDILGGIGYIVGITGMMFYFLGARRKPRSDVAGR